jgi:hypothetical protein
MFDFTRLNDVIGTDEMIRTSEVYAADDSS